MSVTTPLTSPTTERIEVIDALRGFTLLGIAIAHFTEQYYGGMPPEKYAGQSTQTLVDSIAQGISWILISGKFYMIFSFLFGLSFFLQLNKAQENIQFLFKFAWRLLLLLGIGFVHSLHYRGDILTIYAMLGFGLLLTYRLPARYLVLLALLLIADIPSIVTRTIAISTHDTTLNDLIHQDQAVLLQYYEVFKSGDYGDLLKANLASFKDKMNFQVWSGRLYITFGLFLLGYYAGKEQFFVNLPTKIPLLKRLIKYALWSLLGFVVSMFAFFGIGTALTGGLSEDVNIATWNSFNGLINASLALVYVSWFLLLFQTEKWRPRLMHFYAAGRMGLTTYLTQTFFGLLIFGTLGLGFVNQLGAAASFGIATVVFILQIEISKLWLGRFNYGPVEWVWRCLTNLKLHSILKRSGSLNKLGL